MGGVVTWLVCLSSRAKVEKFHAMKSTTSYSFGYLAIIIRQFRIISYRQQCESSELQTLLVEKLK